MDNDQPRKGAAIKMFAVGLFFVGGLDAMLAWRGSFAVEAFAFLLMAAGLVLYFIGSVRARQQT